MILQERVQESVRLATIQMKEESQNKRKRGRFENEEYTGDDANQTKPRGKKHRKPRN